MVRDLGFKGPVQGQGSLLFRDLGLEGPTLPQTFPFTQPNTEPRTGLML